MFKRAIFSSATVLCIAATQLFIACGEETGVSAYKSQLKEMKYQYTPSFFVSAASKGDLKAVELFLKAQISINEPNSSGNTALVMATNKGHVEVAKALLAAGADPYLKSSAGTSSFVDAVRLNREALVKLFVEHLKKTPQGLTGAKFAGIAAAKQGFTPIMAMLIDGGLDVNTTDSFGFTLLATAVKSGHANTVEYLLEKGADVNAKDKEGNSPLKWASHVGYPKVAKILKRHGGKM